jgi:flavin reductase (DIM6/NTAB) family NADH-FMN oxidoreductase RutF
VIDRDTKRCLGQMMKGVQVVGATHDGVTRLYCSHWISQVSFEEPILLASVSPKHDTHPLIVASGAFAVSILAGDQIAQGQYFSYPGRKFHHLAEEYVEDWDGLPVVPDSIAWLRCEVIQRLPLELDHDLFLTRVTGARPGRLKEPPLLYSSRLGWRVTGDKARERGTSVRDRLLERLAGAGIDPGDDEPDDES